MVLTNSINEIPVDETGDTMTGPLILSGDPVAVLGAATKQYVDSVSAGLIIKQACVAASTAALNTVYANGAAGVGATLTNNGAMVAFALDGVSPIVTDRVLIKDQANDFENGIYSVTDVGSGATNWILTRTTDFDQAAEVLPGALVIVSSGTVNATTSWLQTATVATMGTDAIIFSQFTNSPSSYATKELDNLGVTSINASLLSSLDSAIDMGSAVNRFKDLYALSVRTGQGAGHTFTVKAYDVDGLVYTDFITVTANNTPTCVLEDGVEAITQAPADNSTKVATTAYVDAAASGAGANTALSNLAAVAINTTLLSDTDNTDDLGTASVRWKNLYAVEIKTGTSAAQTTIISARDVDGAVDTPFITLTANNTPTCVLANGVTAVTQAASDNSTRIATTAYADVQVTTIAANKALSNLAAVAINTTLVSDSDNTDDLGTGAIRWRTLFGAEVTTGTSAAQTLILSARDVDGAVNTPFITLTANNTPTCVLASAVTGTTQAPADNSLKLATTQYVDTAVSGSGANTALSNLAAVAINTSLISDTDNTDDLGTAAKRWQDLYAVEIKTGTTAAQTTVISARDVDGAVDTPFITLMANNTPTCVLASDVTATTQLSGDNSTKLATTAYVDAALPDPYIYNQTEVDFGATPVEDATFTVTDVFILSTSINLNCWLSGDAPTGKDQDETTMDDLFIVAGPAANGSFTLYIRGMEGYIADKFKINYSYNL